MTIKCHQWAVTLTSYWPLVKTATSDNLIGCCLGVVQLCPDRINHGMRDHYCCDIPGDCGSQYVVMSLRRWWVTQGSQCEQQATHDHDEGKWFYRKTAIILATLHIWGQKEAWDQIFVLCALQLVHTTQQNLILNCRLRFLLILWLDILDGMLYYVISGWSGPHGISQWELGIQPLWPIRGHRDHCSPAGCQAELLLVIMRRKQEKTRWPREIYTARYKRDCFFVWPGAGGGENDEN